jgi:hypothetical protein
MMGESSQFVSVETVLSAGSIRIGSAPAGPDISYSTGTGVPRQLHAIVIGPVDRELGSATAATLADMKGLPKAGKAGPRLPTLYLSLFLAVGDRPASSMGWRRQYALEKVHGHALVGIVALT